MESFYDAIKFDFFLYLLDLVKKSQWNWKSTWISAPDPA